MSARETTKSLLQLLERHYIKPGPFPGGVFVPECGINGSGSQSRADALYVGFTSTSGRLLVGHEIKVSRADWRKELDTAGKADFWADNCHQWFIVAPGPEIVPKEEVPAGWGLMYPSPRTKTRMQIVLRPDTHKDRVPSWDAVRSILGRLDTLRATRDESYRRQLDERLRKEIEQRVADRLATTRAGRGLTRADQDRLASLDRIEEVLGKKIDRFGFHATGDAIGPDLAAAALRLASATRDLGISGPRYEEASLKRSIQQMTEGLAAWEEARAALLQLTNGAA